MSDYPSQKRDLPRGRIVLTDLSPRAYEHPVDRGALAGLRAVPGLAEATRAIYGALPDRAERVMHLGSSVRVGPCAYPRIAEMRDECARVLDLADVPRLHIELDPQPNARAIGLDEPFIVLTTGLVDGLDEEGLRFCIGHEMGHIKSGHTTMMTILVRLLRSRTILSWIPLGALGMRAVIAALMEWSRKAELTADRAGLLASQDPEASLRALMFLAGGGSGEVSLESLLEQADEHLSNDDIRDMLHRYRGVESLSHPLAVLRVAQLHEWAESGDYRSILAGDYARRSEDPESSLRGDVADAARTAGAAATSTAREGAQTLGKVAGTVGDGIRRAGSFVGEAVQGARRGEPSRPEDAPPSPSADTPPSDHPLDLGLRYRDEE